MTQAISSKISVMYDTPGDTAVQLHFLDMVRLFEKCQFLVWGLPIFSSKERTQNYMFFTPLYGVRNTGCPQISNKNFFY
jgi:hypothetical protein